MNEAETASSATHGDGHAAMIEAKSYVAAFYSTIEAICDAAFVSASLRCHRNIVFVDYAAGEAAKSALEEYADE